jgi:D-arabinose 1-dehydrogenase-like Zn-dependent alcohol dehydrogenase
MRAYQVTKFAEQIELREIPTPEPSGTQVLIKVSHAGVCHSDLHIWDGYYNLGSGNKLDLSQRGVELPRTMGHEIFGEIVKGGLEAKDLAIGSKVLVHPWLGCGQCVTCQGGAENLCLKPQSLGVFNDGGYADYCLVPHPRYLIDIGDLDPAVATPYSCSGVTVFSALNKVLPIRDNDWIAIMGAGGLGLNAVAIAKAMGAPNVLSVDIDASKLGAAREMGADAVLDNSNGLTVLDDLTAITGGTLMAALDTVGTEKSSKLALDGLGKGGRYAIVGLYGGELVLPLPTVPLRAISVLGSYTGNLLELKALIELVKTGSVKPLPVETRKMSTLSDTLKDLREGRIVGRVVLTNSN